MTWLKVFIAVLLIAIASLAYILLTRFFPSEEVFFMGSRALTRALVLDLSIKSNKEYPTFLAENSGFLVVHPAKSAEDHRDDVLETRDILALVEKTVCRIRITFFEENRVRDTCQLRDFIQFRHQKYFF